MDVIAHCFLTPSGRAPPSRPMKLLIPHDFGFHKYHPPGEALPYEATGRKLADEIAARDSTVDILQPRSASDSAAMLGEADALVAYSLTRADFERATRLKWIQAASAGIDHFLRSSDPSLAEIGARGIVLTKASGVTRIVIGEHVFAMILAISRGVPVPSGSRTPAALGHLHGQRDKPPRWR